MAVWDYMREMRVCSAGDLKHCGISKGDILPASQSVGYNRSTFRLPSPDLNPLACISYTVRLCLKCTLPPYVRPFPHHPKISLPSAQEEEHLYSHERSPAYSKIRNDMIYHINPPLSSPHFNHIVNTPCRTPENFSTGRNKNSGALEKK